MATNNEGTLYDFIAETLGGSHVFDCRVGEACWDGDGIYI